MNNKKSKKLRGRPKKIISYPSVNYHYILFDVIDKKTNKVIRALGFDEKQAKSTVKFEKVKVRPTKVKSLTDSIGHKRAHKLLKKFGEQWV